MKSPFEGPETLPDRHAARAIRERQRQRNDIRGAHVGPHEPRNAQDGIGHLVNGFAQHLVHTRQGQVDEHCPADAYPDRPCIRGAHAEQLRLLAVKHLRARLKRHRLPRQSVFVRKLDVDVHLDAAELVHDVLQLGEMHLRVMGDVDARQLRHRFDGFRRAADVVRLVDLHQLPVLTFGTGCRAAP